MALAQAAGTSTPATSSRVGFSDFKCTGTDRDLTEVTVSTVLFILSFCVMVVALVISLYSCCFQLFMRELGGGNHREKSEPAL